MKFIVFVFSILIFNLLSAQKPSKDVNYRATISFSPSALLDVDNGIMVGSELRLHSQIALSLDAAYIFESYFFNNDQKVSGFTLRPAFRYYLTDRETPTFLQLQGLFKKVDYTVKGWVGKDCVNDVPAYSQFTDYGFNKSVWGINVMAGIVQPIFRPSKHFVVDAAAGAGLRFKTQQFEEKNCCFLETNILTPQSKKVTISLPVNIKLAYIIH